GVGGYMAFLMGPLVGAIRFKKLCFREDPRGFKFMAIWYVVGCLIAFTTVILLLIFDIFESKILCTCHWKKHLINDDPFLYRLDLCSLLISAAFQLAYELLFVPLVDPEREHVTLQMSIMIMLYTYAACANAFSTLMSIRNQMNKIDPELISLLFSYE